MRASDVYKNSTIPVVVQGTEALGSANNGKLRELHVKHHVGINRSP